MSEFKKASNIFVDKNKPRSYNNQARGINSVVECHLAKVKVASSSLVSRSTQDRNLSSGFSFSFGMIREYNIP